ncbi:hypothetical protein LBW62_23855 [Ralstonia solanacearum]|uniref:hypothetical protein n=1 Tax=Ralstonia solanacearum TaxID=305 RepID=UPI0005C64E68|nr:hypothetical protein [Ralstonia solanacearum]MDB0544257.1 hypothetical protein [Ralstonia solanacearum]MDB0554132.1 hypothetical protein [Ralstonia solanacearum]MDB0559209.1 hypothetical protein [Ralstonia solanacearum]
MEAKRQKINVTLPAPMVERLEAERRQLSERAGCGMTASQTVEALLQRALLQPQNDFQPSRAG